LKVELEDSISGVTLGGIVGLNFSDTAGLFVVVSAWEGANVTEDGIVAAAETLAVVLEAKDVVGNEVGVLVSLSIEGPPCEKSK